MTWIILNVTFNLRLYISCHTPHEMERIKIEHKASYWTPACMCYSGFLTKQCITWSSLHQWLSNIWHYTAQELHIFQGKFLWNRHFFFSFERNGGLQKKRVTEHFNKMCVIWQQKCTGIIQLTETITKVCFTSLSKGCLIAYSSILTKLWEANKKSGKGIYIFYVLSLCFWYFSFLDVAICCHKVIWLWLLLYWTFMTILIYIFLYN